MSYAVQETWRNHREKKIYGSFHDGSRRIVDIKKNALFNTIEEAKEFLAGVSEDGEVDDKIDSEIVNVITRTRYSPKRKGDR